MPCVFYSDHFAVPLPPDHRFPMAKYARLRERLLVENVLHPADLAPAEHAPIEAVLAVHDEGYVRGFVAGTLERSAIARIGFPWSRELVARCFASAGGTLLAARAALEHGFGGNLAGGTHHAHRDFGSGFCVFNDLAIAAVELLARGAAKSVLVVDLDVHQGDGTAALFEADERVFTFSMHGARNFPARKQRSDLDVELPDGTRDGPYVDSLRAHLALAVERSRPDFVLYQAGVDPLEQDKLGRLALTHAGLFERDRQVFMTAREIGVPIVVTLGGGYAQPIDASIQAHIGTYRAMRETFGARA